MNQNILYGLLATAASFSVATAAGTPVLQPRASTTVTPITITGNGQFTSRQDVECDANNLQLFTRGVSDSTSEE